MMTESNLTRRKRKARLDMLAAQIILASFLESGRAQFDPPQSLD
jgi:RNase H-fold protein (predicted Holliday junction resolvase)